MGPLSLVTNTNSEWMKHLQVKPDTYHCEKKRQKNASGYWNRQESFGKDLRGIENINKNQKSFYTASKHCYSYCQNNEVRFLSTAENTLYEVVRHLYKAEEIVFNGPSHNKLRYKLY